MLVLRTLERSSKRSKRRSARSISKDAPDGHAIGEQKRSATEAQRLGQPLRPTPKCPRGPPNRLARGYARHADDRLRVVAAGAQARDGCGRGAGPALTDT